MGGLGVGGFGKTGLHGEFGLGIGLMGGLKFGDLGYWAQIGTGVEN